MTRGTSKAQFRTTGWEQSGASNSPDCGWNQVPDNSSGAELLFDRRSPAEDAVRLESPYSFADTLIRLQSTLESESLRVFVTIDHRAAARSVGLDLPPTTVVVYGNPKGGTPLMLAAPDFALELPLRVLVREDQQGRVYVIYNPSTALEGKHGLPRGMAERLASAETVIADALAAPTRQN